MSINGETQRTATKRDQHKRLLVQLTVLVLVLFRFYLVARDEIVPRTGDAISYAFQARFYLMGHLPEHPPGLSYLAFLASRFGIPFKLALDLISIGTALLVSRCIAHKTRSNLVRLIVLAILLYNPWFLKASQMFMSEPLSGILCLLLLLATVPFVTRPSTRWTGWEILGIGGVMSGLALTRPETLLLVVYWLTVIAVVGVQAYRHREGPSWHLGAVFLPLVVLLASVGIVQQVHRRFYGVAAISAMESQGMRTLCDTLYSIVPKRSVRYAPTTYQSMTAACDASPTLHEIRGALLDPSYICYRDAAEKLGLKGEFGTWMGWVLLHGFGGVVNAESEARMLKAAAEIRAAQASGHLQRRWATFPMDPLVQTWGNEVAPTFVHSLALSLNPLKGMDVESMDVSNVEDLIDQSDFAEGLRLRAGSGSEGRLCLYGTLNGATSTFHRVRLADDKKAFAESIIEVDSFSTPRFQIDLQGRALAYRTGNLRLIFVEKDGRIERAASPPFSLTERYQSLHVGILYGQEVWKLKCSAPQPDHSLRFRFRTWLQLTFPTMLPLAFVLMLLIGALQKGAGARGKELGAFLLIGGLLILERNLYYAVVRVNTGWSLERYTQPSHLTLVVLILVGGFVLGGLLRKGFVRSRRGPLHEKSTKKVIIRK